MLRLDGNLVAKARQTRLIQEISTFRTQTGKPPGLAVVLVGQDPASQIYVRNKVKTCEALGMRSFRFDLPAETSEAALLEHISVLNHDPHVHGILVQLPLPSQINEDNVLAAIAPAKDPDGLTYENLGLLWGGRRRVAPCTPAGVMAILEHYQIPVAGRRAVVVGRSNIVGKPMAQLLLDANATVTICHSKTVDLEAQTRGAEIVVVAAGRERFLGKSAFAKDAVVIDVGMHRPSAGAFQGKVCGDVRWEELDGWVRAATPVPGGVGPMTIQMLMENTLHLARLLET
ncbi:MAG: bifunctional methylenetetrahydrofolate dehydrogenase/methenyltetrahydrofolate cyclohydrolase FolD [Bdellovibrionaceae bacterium]|nr:bifunctional methylenetetrahydrofolate dehydrogenase/methenyltetrahydrofolate cyclohydrolase FolD [Pseudobdellovibrionaceae bacterium]